MSTTISTRLDDDEVVLLDSLSRLAGFDRSTLLKLILRKGISNMRMDLAVEKYRNEKTNLVEGCRIGWRKSVGFYRSDAARRA